MISFAGPYKKKRHSGSERFFLPCPWLVLIKLFDGMEAVSGHLKYKEKFTDFINYKKQCRGSVTIWYRSVPLTNGSGSGSCDFRQ